MELEREFVHWHIAKVTGWSMHYIESLGQARINRLMAFEDGIAAARSK